MGDRELNQSSKVAVKSDTLRIVPRQTEGEEKEIKVAIAKRILEIRKTLNELPISKESAAYFPTQEEVAYSRKMVFILTAEEELLDAALKGDTTEVKLRRAQLLKEGWEEGDSLLAQKRVDAFDKLTENRYSLDRQQARTQKLTPKEKMTARLKEIRKTLDSLSEDEYARIKDIGGIMPKKDYRRAFIDLNFLAAEETLYDSALKGDKNAVESAKSEIKEWGEKTGDAGQAMKILDNFKSNSE